MLEDIEQKIATFQRENKEMRNQMEKLVIVMKKTWMIFSLV